jgi:hypothetical protein
MQSPMAAPLLMSAHLASAIQVPAALAQRAHQCKPLLVVALVVALMVGYLPLAPHLLLTL